MQLKVSLHEKQKEAFNLLQDDITEEILFWGWARWGKSYLGAVWLITQAFSKPWSSWLMGRTVLKELYNSTLVSFWEAIKAIEKINWMETGTLMSTVKFNEKRGTLYFKETDVLIYLMDLSYQPSDPEYNRIGSLSLTGCFIDEAQQVHPKAITVLSARFSLLSQTDKDWNVIWRTRKKCLYTCNPDKGWIYKDFYKPYKDWTLPPNKKFLPSLVHENTKIPEVDRENYVRSLKEKEHIDPVSVQRLLYGNFDYDATEGRLFEYDALNDLFTNPEYDWKKKYITCDVARWGKDTTTIAIWEGYNLIQFLKHDQKNDFTEKKLKELSQTYKVPMSQILVDENWVGWGVVDNLKCRGFIGNRTPVSPLAKKYKAELNRNYKDLRCQCLMMLSKVVNERRMSIRDINIKQLLTEELDLVFHTNLDKDEKIEVSTKIEMKEKLGRSTDTMDVVFMRMWFDLYLNDSEVAENERIYNPHVDEDIYWNTIASYQKKILEEYFEKITKPSNTYTAKSPITIY
jgi:phage terminase large subunit